MFTIISEQAENFYSLPQIPTTTKIQPKTAREERRYPIFVASELRDCSKMLEKADIKIIDFDDFVFCTTESKSIILMSAFS